MPCLPKLVKAIRYLSAVPPRQRDELFATKISQNLHRISLTDNLIESLGDIVYLEVKKPGNSIKEGQHMASLESSKGIVELHAPFDCKITKINEELVEQPSLLNRTAGNLGWLCEVETSTT